MLTNSASCCSCRARALPEKVATQRADLGLCRAWQCSCQRRRVVGVLSLPPSLPPQPLPSLAAHLETRDGHRVSHSTGADALRLCSIRFVPPPSLTNLTCVPIARWQSSRAFTSRASIPPDARGGVMATDTLLANESLSMLLEGRNTLDGYTASGAPTFSIFFRRSLHPSFFSTEDSRRTLTKPLLPARTARGLELGF